MGVGGVYFIFLFLFYPSYVEFGAGLPHFLWGIGVDEYDDRENYRKVWTRFLRTATVFVQIKWKKLKLVIFMPKDE